MNTETLHQPSTFFSIDTCRSYSTEANLIKGLNKLFNKEEIYRAMVVKNREGRFTAIFPVSAADGYLGRFAQHGFMTIG